MEQELETGTIHEVRQVRSAEFESETLSGVLEVAAEWFRQNDSDIINIWSISSPHKNGDTQIWYMYVTFMYWNDANDPTMK